MMVCLVEPTTSFRKVRCRQFAAVVMPGKEARVAIPEECSISHAPTAVADMTWLL
jgi:hypothetical protein